MTTTQPAVLESGEDQSDLALAEHPGFAKRRNLDVARWARGALLAIPVVLVVWMGWRHRWTADDGFINFRIVRQLEAGRGPVFNAGDRVEVGTSPIWIGILLVLDRLAPLRLEWIAVLAGLACTGGAVALAIGGTRRALRDACAVGGLLLPLGALVYAALPPAWDFATSGLECGLGLFWIASCWALLCRRVAEPGLRRSTTLAVVIGIGPLIRPDFSIFTIAFVIALILLDHRHRLRDVARILIAMAVLPLVVELARMAYYGEIVPNTAIAKEASLANWSQGWSYFIDFAGGYLLLLPVCGLLGMAALRWRNATGVGPRRFRILAIAAVVGGAVHAVYIVRVGGDFMHARMLLPTLFLLLCPVAAVEVRRTTAARFGAGALVAWAIAAALWLGPPYSAAHSGSVFDPSTGIADERLYWLRSAHAAHPVTIDDYLAHQPYARAGAATRRAAARGARGLVVDALRDPRPSVALARGVRGPVVASAPALGLYGYAAGIDVTVVDDHGLASVLAARQRLEHRGRPGHEKALPNAWFVALYANPAAPLPEGVSARDVSAARRALGCGTLRDVVGRSTRPLDPPQALDDLIAAVRDNGFRFSSNPGAAAREECGT